jgi:hypothetical protein
VVFTRRKIHCSGLAFTTVEEKPIVLIVFYCYFRDNGNFPVGQSLAHVDFMLVTLAKLFTLRERERDEDLVT